MWDERCSANFILPDQLSPKTSVKSVNACPLPRRRDFCYFSELGWLNMRCVRPAHSASVHSTSGLSRRGWVHSEQLPSHILFQGDTAVAVASLQRLAGRRVNGAGERGSVTLLRPSPGTSADIAVRHRIEPQRRGCVSNARSSTRRCWDLPWNTSQGDSSLPSQIQTTIS